MESFFVKEHHHSSIFNEKINNITAPNNEMTQNKSILNLPNFIVGLKTEVRTMQTHVNIKTTNAVTMLLNYSDICQNNIINIKKRAEHRSYLFWINVYLSFEQKLLWLICSILLQLLKHQFQHYFQKLI